MNRENDELNVSSFLMGAVFGAAISAIAALLFAPKSGKDLRKDIGEGTAKTLESTDEYLELAREKGTKVIHDVEDAALSYFNLAADKAEDALADTEDVVEQEIDKFEETADKIEEELTEE